MTINEMRAKINFLKRAEFYLNCKDRWDSDDYREMENIKNRIFALEEQAKELGYIKVIREYCETGYHAEYVNIPDWAIAKINRYYGMIAYKTIDLAEEAKYRYMDFYDDAKCESQWGNKGAAERFAELPTPEDLLITVVANYKEWLVWADTEELL